MPVALQVLVFVSLVPYVLAAMGGYVRIKQLGHLDNTNPRTQEKHLIGNAARTIAAQSNAWEALAFYSATILTVYASGVPWPDLNTPALIFGATRIIHPILYIGGVSTARSVTVVIGLACCVYMLWLTV